MLRKEQSRRLNSACTPMSARRDQYWFTSSFFPLTGWGSRIWWPRGSREVLASHWFLEFWLHTLSINAPRSSSPGLSDEQSGRIISSIQSRTISAWKVSSPRHCSGVSHGLFGFPFLFPLSSFPPCSEKIPKALPHGAGTQRRKSPNNLFDIPWCHVLSPAADGWMQWSCQPVSKPSIPNMLDLSKPTLPVWDSVETAVLGQKAWDDFPLQSVSVRSQQD